MHVNLFSCLIINTDQRPGPLLPKYQWEMFSSLHLIRISAHPPAVMKCTSLPINTTILPIMPAPVNPNLPKPASPHYIAADDDHVIHFLLLAPLKISTVNFTPPVCIHHR